MKYNLSNKPKISSNLKEKIDLVEIEKWFEGFESQILALKSMIEYYGENERDSDRLYKFVKEILGEK